jgi:drug/metabolite transporter (DMT)-like permease
MVLQGALFFLGVAVVRRKALLAELRTKAAGVALSGVLSGGGYGIAIWAMSTAPIALVAALRETAVLFAAVIGVAVLREPLGRVRVLSAVLVAIGAVLVRAG